MKFKDLLVGFKNAEKVVTLTFGEKLSLTGRLIELNDDYLKVNLMAFNRTEKKFTPTSNNYIVPLASILFLEEPKA
jgi:hypothetical protein